MKKITKDEKSLLMFFEDMAVNQWGWIDNMQKMNEIDMEIMKSWNEAGFILAKRASRKIKGRMQLTYVVKLSDSAWRMAHKLRKEKALRHIPEKFND